MKNKRANNIVLSLLAIGILFPIFYYGNDALTETFEYVFGCFSWDMVLYIGLVVICLFCLFVIGKLWIGEDK